MSTSPFLLLLAAAPSLEAVGLPVPAGAHADGVSATSARTGGRAGTVGFRYFEEANHGNHGMAGLTFEGQSDIDLAVHVLEKSADTAAPTLNNLGHYADWLERHPFQYVVPKERLR